MTIQLIDVGARENDGTGDPTRVAFMKANANFEALQQGIDDVSLPGFAEHVSDPNNPHGTTKAQLGLSSVDDTPDADKPLSTPQAAALNGALAELADAVIAALDALPAELVQSGSPVYDAIAAKAAKGANSDITSLSGLTTPLSKAQGGTGATSLLAALPRGSQVLTAASGNFTVPADVQFVGVILQAAGGGGGGIANAVASAAGGGPGEYIHAIYKVTPGQVIAYTNDAIGGLGGAVGNNNGAPGGNSTFGDLVAFGGYGGAGSASGNAAGTAQATATATRHITPPTPNIIPLTMNLTVNAAGQTTIGGASGTPFSSWGRPAPGATNAAGNSSTGYGPGGGGANASPSAIGALSGGNGAPGAIAVYW